jgi:hypothetical protein
MIRHTGDWTPYLRLFSLGPMSSRQNVYDGERFGRARCDTGAYPRHRHSFGYICVVIDGSFIEAGDAGRFRLRAGDVLVHRNFEAHMDVFGASAAEVLNLPLVQGLPEQGLIKCSNLDAVAIEAERDPGRRRCWWLKPS